MAIVFFLNNTKTFIGYKRELYTHLETMPFDRFWHIVRGCNELSVTQLLCQATQVM